MLDFSPGKNGEEFPMEISYYSSPIQLNGRRHAVAIVHDITARKRIETEIQRVKGDLEREHKEAEEIGRSLLRKQPLDSRWTAIANVEPCSKAGGARGFLSGRLRDSDATDDWLVVFDASGHGKGAAKFQEVALGGLITLIGTGASMRDSLRAVNGAPRGSARADIWSATSSVLCVKPRGRLKTASVGWRSSMSRSTPFVC